MAFSTKPGTESLGSGKLPGYSELAIDKSTSRPYTLAQNELDITIRAINKAIRVGSVAQSCFTTIMDETFHPMGSNSVKIPDAAFVRINPENKEAPAQIQELYFELPLAGEARVNSQELTGYERGRLLKKMEVYYAIQKFGTIDNYYSHDMDAKKMLNYIAQETPQIMRWAAEDFDKQIQQALLQRYSYPIRDFLVSKGIINGGTIYLNPNIYLPSLRANEQPLFGSNHVDNVIAAMSSVQSIPECMLTVNRIYELEAYCNDRRIPTFNIKGIGDKRILVLSANAYRYLLLRGGLMEYWRNMNNLNNDDTLRLYNLKGEIANFLIMVNERAPTIRTASGTLTIGYLNPGNEDDRVKSEFSNSSNIAFDVSYVLSAGAVIEYLVDDISWKTQEFEYGTMICKGIFKKGCPMLGSVYSTNQGKNIEAVGSVVVLTPVTRNFA